MRILVVEDDRRMAALLRQGLTEEGHAVTVAGDGRTALAMTAASEFDLVILDVMLPRRDVLKTVRGRGVTTPVLMLTARDAVADKVAGLDLGADDYLTKPFSLPVLLARARMLLRRGARPSGGDAASVEAPFVIGSATVHPERFELERKGETHSLTAKELALLLLLWARRGMAVSRGEILQEVWDLHPETRTRVVDTFVLRLRKLIEPDPSRPRHLVSVRSFGYRLIPEPRPA
jgi:DNA-binding response OmpR family regulator